MYPNEYPKIDSYVSVLPIKFNLEQGIVTYQLLEYNNIEGIALLCHLTKKKRLKSYNKQSVL